jgi:hypothetical protein
VQVLLGHFSSEVTREVYLHSISADAPTPVQKVEDLLVGPKWTQVLETATELYRASFRFYQPPHERDIRGLRKRNLRNMLTNRPLRPIASSRMGIFIRLHTSPSLTSEIPYFRDSLTSG